MDRFFSINECDRCHQPLKSRTISMFNTDIICPECKELETRDPRYEEARQAELNALRKGKLNFKGIGWKSKK